VLASASIGGPIDDDPMTAHAYQSWRELRV
jgi:hypothetical protein